MIQTEPCGRHCVAVCTNVSCMLRGSDEIVARLLAAMAGEGRKLLDEKIAVRASDIDLVLVNGYGFPAHKGGPMYLATLGA